VDYPSAETFGRPPPDVSYEGTWPETVPRAREDRLKRASIVTIVITSTALVVAIALAAVRVRPARTDGEPVGSASSTAEVSGSATPTEACEPAPFRVMYLPWLPEDAEVPAPIVLQDEDSAILVWFEDQKLEWDGAYVTLQTSPKPPLGGPAFLRDFPTTSVRGEVGYLVWVGDPGVGELDITWSEGAGPCNWYSLGMSRVGATQAEAESAISAVADSLM